MSDLSVHVNQNGMVSSKIVAEKFNKRHDNVLRDFQELKRSLPANFVALNFEENRINTLQASKTELSEVRMSRDGFIILAMGFNGPSALKWKVAFLEAFNTMEETIKAEIPALQAQVLHYKRKAEALPPAKKPHGNKGLVQVSTVENSIFENENGERMQIVFKRVPKEDGNHSRLSMLEGELHRLSVMAEGMQKKIRWFTTQIARERRL